MWNFENSAVNGIPELKYSRFIASWTKMHRRMKVGVYFGEDFKNWLRSIRVPESDVANIAEMANCGKLELETSAAMWIGEQKNLK